MNPISVLEDKHIFLGVTGSIACYKAVDLASKLTQAGALVDVAMTAAAQRFVSPLTFQAVTGRSVYTDMWQSDSVDGLPTHIAHVGLAEDADIIAIIPATAHTLARLANGLADDLISVTALAARCPLLVAPAMDGSMYAHPAVRANIDTLSRRGAVVVPPDVGRFASGMVGEGRLPETRTLMGYIRRVLGQNGVLYGRRIVVSAGGTREPIDPVRYLSNRSTGRQGHALAQAALDAGAREVVLVTASEWLPVPVGAEVINVDTAQEMKEAITTVCANTDLLIMAAAVADFRPATAAGQKIKKESVSDDLSLQLLPTADILTEIKGVREETGYPRVVVGFAAETENLLDNAQAKLERKGLDLMVANDVTAEDAGFGVETNRVVILDADGNRYPLELATKAVISEAIINHVADLLGD